MALRRFPISVAAQSRCDGAESLRPGASLETGFQVSRFVELASCCICSLLFLNASISFIICRIPDIGGVSSGLGFVEAIGSKVIVGASRSDVFPMRAYYTLARRRGLLAVLTLDLRNSRPKLKTRCCLTSDVPNRAQSCTRPIQKGRPISQVMSER